MNEIFTETFVRAGTTVGVSIVLGAFVKLRVQFSKEEEIFTNGSINILRKTLLGLLMLLFFYLYTLFITSIAMGSISKFYLFMWGLFFNWYTANTVLFLSFLLLAIRTFLRKAVRNLVFKSKNKTKALIMGILIFIPLVLFLMYSLYCGFLINGLIAESKEINSLKVTNTFIGLFHFHKIEEPVNYYIISVAGLYALIIFLLFKFMSFISKEKITVKIKLKDGKELVDKFIINYNLDNSLLISNWESRFGDDKMLIPKGNIEYIKFKRTIYILGQQSPGSGIVDPKYFDKGKEAKLKEDFLSTVSKYL